MKRLLFIPLILMFVTACGLKPHFLRDAYKYKPEKKARIVNYWSCESQEEYFWGDCNWSYGYYLPIEDQWRLVGVSWCVGSEMDAGFALNAVYEDRDTLGPLEKSQLGSQSHMHCRMMNSFITPIRDSSLPIGKQVYDSDVKAYGLVKGLTLFPESGGQASLINPDDYDTETLGHEVSHQHWGGEWEPKNWTEENYINTVGLQPRQKWINPDPPPYDAYNRDWHINRGQPKGIPYSEVCKIVGECD